MSKKKVAEKGNGMKMKAMIQKKVAMCLGSVSLRVVSVDERQQSPTIVKLM